MLDESQEEKNYSVNWVNLFIKIIIFAVLLLLLIWVVSLFSTKKCQTTQTDYYVVSYFSKEQYTTNYTNNTYTYRYTIELEDITTKNSKDVSLLSSNYFIHLYVNYMASKLSFLKNLIFFSMLFKPAATFLIFRHHLFHLIPERSRMIHNF